MELCSISTTSGAINSNWRPLSLLAGELQKVQWHRDPEQGRFPGRTKLKLSEKNMAKAAQPAVGLKGLSMAMTVCVVVATAASAPAGALNIQVASYVLANGMQVVVIPDHRAPVVTQMIWYKVGAADEPEGKGGIAH